MTQSRITTPRTAFKSSRLTSFTEKTNRTNSTFHITFSNLPSARQKLPKNKVVPPYIQPTKTKIFRSSEEAAEFYDIKPIVSSIHLSPKYDQIYFSNVFDDSLFSSFLIAFISSYFPFLTEFMNLCNEGEISLKNVCNELKLLSNESPSNNISYFIMLFQSLNVSIAGPMHFDSLSDLEVVFQAEFEKNHTEDIIVKSQIKSFPPNLVKVKSSTVLNLTGQDLSFNYKLRWVIATKDDIYFPVIFHSDFTADVMYDCSKSQLFGSLSALFYSGAEIVYVCYSLRDHDCPEIKLCNE
ncbi:hypothetical protein TRFO_23074 [Tritrichomonas foetus]|uniref:Uncharacterized protein n=1 Tax=Tritrichomonas foetus TaxID=1144522 RepID=A0A1J4KAK4_9EUKA|nr:hypothetical protein TRFO_23074 [Tritrichomonas foetus]|eukprot:OHT08463.1 hypothetical protein TRFO_23074 [Tritrichomonas foetus]